MAYPRLSRKPRPGKRRLDRTLVNSARQALQHRRTTLDLESLCRSTAQELSVAQIIQERLRRLRSPAEIIRRRGKMVQPHPNGIEIADDIVPFAIFAQ